MEFRNVRWVHYTHIRQWAEFNINVRYQGTRVAGL